MNKALHRQHTVNLADPVEGLVKGKGRLGAQLAGQIKPARSGVNPLDRRKALELAQNSRLGGRGDVDENGSPDLPGPGVFRKFHGIARDDPIAFEPVEPRLHRCAREPQLGAQLCHRRAGIGPQKGQKSAVCFVEFDHNDENSGKTPIITDKSCKVPSHTDEYPL